ncbi:hypothetical protein AB3N59_09050 [Leptospira sp. WS92.C1]
MKPFYSLCFLFLFWNQSATAETSSFSDRLISLKRFLGDPVIVEKSWLVKSIPVWKKEEESRLEVFLKKILTSKLSKLKGSSFPSKESLKTQFKSIPNLGGIRIRNQKTELFFWVSSGTEFPNLSQIKDFQIESYYVDFYLGRQGGLASAEFPKTGLTSAFYFFSEDETLLYFQKSAKQEITELKSMEELNSYYKNQINRCDDCEKLKLSEGTLFVFPAQSSIFFWLRWGLGFLLVLLGLVLTIFFFRSFLIRNQETLKKAIQAQKNLEKEKNSILTQ